MGTTLVSPTVVKPKSLSCPNCGGPVEIRGFAHTLSVVCPQCLSVLDATTPEFQILQAFQGKQRAQPKIPLGSRGKIGDTQYEVIGFQVREVVADEVFTWDEYLLFNPYKGFRYITEYQGHWNFVRVLNALPEPSRSGGKVAMRLEGHNFLRFDAMKARTAYVLGEFPWQVRVGDSALCEDYVAPPLMLSSESTDDEVAWSRAEYMTGAQIWPAFKLPGSPPYAEGIFANQPSPYKGKVASAWRTWLWLNVALVALWLYFSVSSAGHDVFQQKYTFSPVRTADSSFVTSPFQLTGRDSNVEVAIKTDLTNNWAYFNFALINENTGQAFDFAREVSYYRDSDGNEGSPNNSVMIPSVPSGKYYLRVEPEMDRGAAPMSYQLIVRRDVPNNTFFWMAAVLLLIPPIAKTIRATGFESRRWRESDYGSALSKMGGGDD
jgi:hypothetical protein